MLIISSDSVHLFVHLFVFAFFVALCIYISSKYSVLIRQIYVRYFFFFQSFLFFLFVRHLLYYCDKLFSSLMLVVTLFVQFFVRLYLKVKFGEQGWRSGESTHLQPMCLNSYPVSMSYAA